MKHYNIVWFCADQLRWDTISGYGNPHIRTPNIDRLMATGATFERAYAQSPVCTPSRASFLTGRYPKSCRSSINGNQIFSRDETLITKTLRDSGYVCGLTGKLHLTSSSAKDHQELRTDDGYSYFQWSHMGYDLWNRGVNNYMDWLEEKGVDWHAMYKAPVINWPPKSNYPIPARIQSMPDELHQTTWCVEKAMEFIDQSVAEDAGRPWCVSINPFAPPPPQRPPPAVKGPGRGGGNPPAPGEGGGDSYYIGAQSGMVRTAVGLTDDEKRENTLEYYALVEHLDHQLGRLIDHLEESGQRENTIIMFMSDHGECLGDHGLYWKGGFFYECNVHVPLIFSCPGLIKEGLRSDALVELMDVAPTVLELLELPVPQYMQAKSLAGILTGKSDPHHHKDCVYAEYYYSALLSNKVYATMYFDGRYKMIVHHDDPVSELYDLETDPQEFDNLWGRPEYQDLIFTYYQKCFNHAVMANEDTVLGEKSIF